MIYDLLLIAIFITFLIIGYAQGAMKSLIGIIVSFVSYIFASMLAKLIASWCYMKMIFPSIEKAVSDTIGGIVSGVSSDLSENMPQWLQLALKLSNIDTSGLIPSSGSGLTEQAVSAVDSAVQPVIVGFLSVLLTIALYFLLVFLLSKLAVKPVLKLFDLPGLNLMNRIFGGVLGLAEAFIIVSMLAYLLRLILPYIHTEVKFINESTIYNSFIFYYFYSGNIFAALLGKIF